MFSYISRQTARTETTPLRPALLTLKDIAAELQVSVRTVQRLVPLGKLPVPVRVGRQWRWRRTDIEKWIAAGCPSRREPQRQKPRRAG